MATLFHPPRLLWRLTGLVCLGGALAGEPPGNGTPRAIRFDLPSDSPSAALKRFAIQSGLEVLISPAPMPEVLRTRPVKGVMSARQALEAMLEDTGLSVTPAPGLGELAVRRHDAEHPPDGGGVVAWVGSDSRVRAARTGTSRSEGDALSGGAGTGAVATSPAGPRGAEHRDDRGSDVRIATGTLRGRISNQATQAFLEGAQVLLTPSGLTALTDFAGRYVFPRVPAGRYLLTASYAGLDSSTSLVVVGVETATESDVALTAGTYVLERLVVPGEREGGALAVTQQRHAHQVKHVLSADAFGNVADENLGSFLQRLPGLSGEVQEGQVAFIRIRGVMADLNAVTVDGTRSGNGGTRSGLNRGFEIDTIPADFIDRIEVIKAPTPDMDADAIGGSVNLKTKSAFSHRGRLVSHRLGASYGIARKTLRPQGSFMYSDVLETRGGASELGVMVTGSFSWAENPRDVNLVNWQGTPDPGSAWFHLLNAGEDYLTHKRGGLGIRFDYRMGTDATLTVNLMYSGTHDRLFRRLHNFQGVTDSRIVPGYTSQVTETRDIVYRLNQADRRRGVRLYNLHVGGETRKGETRLDYRVSFSPSHGYEQRTNVSASVPGVGFRFDRRGVRSDYGRTTFEQISGPDIAEISHFELGPVVQTEVDKRDQVSGAQVNLRRALPATVPLSLQAGLRWRAQQVRLQHRPTVYDYLGPEGDALARFLDRDDVYQPRALRGQVPGVHFLHLPTVRYEQEVRPDYFRADEALALQARLAGDRRASESVHAAYLMGQADVGRLGILAGVRVEETRVSASGTLDFIPPEEQARRAAWVGPVTREESLRRTQAQYGHRVGRDGSYRNVFPAAHLRYAFSNGLLARLGYSAGIGRPSFENLIPSDRVDDAEQTVTMHRPDLKPQRVTNLDVSLEYYFEPAGLLSLGVFQKEISDFIFTADLGPIPAGTDNGFGGERAGYRLITQTNGGSARMRGLEVNYHQQLSHLSGFWRGFSLYANATWLEAAGDFGSAPGVTVTSRRVPGFTPFTANAGISYVHRSWSVRVKQHWQGRGMTNVLNEVPALQQLKFGSKLVDLGVTYQVGAHHSLWVDVINVFGDPVGGASYIYIPGRPRGGDRFNTELKFGLTARF